MGPDANNSGMVVKTSVSVQTSKPFNATDSCEGQEGIISHNGRGVDLNLLKAMDCSLDIASQALEKSQEINSEANNNLQSLLGFGTESLDLNLSQELLDIIATGDLFNDGPFGRSRINEVQLTAAASDTNYSLPPLTWERNRWMKRQVAKLQELMTDDEDMQEVILDEKTGMLKLKPSEEKSQATASSSPKVDSQETVQLILDETTGEFLNGATKKIVTDFNSKCSMDSGVQMSGETEKSMFRPGMADGR